MPGPLLAVDAPSLLYRAFYALPKTITDDDGTPVNALLGVSNLVLQAVEKHAPARRRAVLRRGGRALPRRALPHLPRRPHRHARGARAPVERRAPSSSAPSTGPSLRHETLEADDLLGGLAEAETQAGGQALLFTGDRDMFQCVSDDVTVLWPAGKGETEPIGPGRGAQALRRAPRPGARLHRPARRPVRRAARRQGHRREDRPRAAQRARHASTRCSPLPISLRPRVRQSLTDQARGAARVPRDRHAAADGRRAPARRADRLRRRRRGGARALDEPPCGATWTRGRAPDGEPLVRTPREEAPRCSDAFARRTIQRVRPTAAPSP